MANENPPIKNTAWSTIINLTDATAPARFKSNPTLAAGDFSYSIDDGAFATAEITVTVDPAGTKSVKIVMSADGMNGDVIHILGSDQTEPPEWCDFGLTILTTAS